MRQLVLASILVLIATAAAAVPSATTPPPTNQDQNASRLQERMTRVEDQLSVIREYNDDLLSIVAWSLGTVAGIAVVLIGFNWFQSSRTLNAEFSALREDFLASLNKTTTEQVTRIEDTIAETKKEMKAAATEVVEEKLKRIRGSISWLTSEVRELNFKSLRDEVKHWIERPVPSNAVGTSGELITCAIKLDQDWRISEAVDLLNESLDLLSKDGNRLETQELSELEAIVEQLPASHKTTKAVLLQRLAKMHEG
jgi:hypothetical protein